MIDPLSQKLGDVMGGLCVLPAICGEIFWSASILSALGKLKINQTSLTTFVGVVALR